MKPDQPAATKSGLPTNDQLMLGSTIRSLNNSDTVRAFQDSMSAFGSDLNQLDRTNQLIGSLNATAGNFNVAGVDPLLGQSASAESQTVRAGDFGGSYERIARANLPDGASQREVNNYVGQLFELNGTTNARTIQPDQMVQLPTANTAAATAGLGLYGKDIAVGEQQKWDAIRAELDQAAAAVREQRASTNAAVQRGDVYEVSTGSWNAQSAPAQESRAGFVDSATGQWNDYSREGLRQDYQAWAAEMSMTQGIGKGAVNVLPETATAIGKGLVYLGAAWADGQASLAGVDSNLTERAVTAFDHHTGTIFPYANTAEAIGGFIGGGITLGVLGEAIQFGSRVGFGSPNAGVIDVGGINFNARPSGVSYEGTVYRLEDPARVGTTFDIHAGNIAADHRYSGSGVGSVYGATSPETAFAEIDHYGLTVGRVSASQEVSMQNVLDLTNPAVRQELNISLDQITGDSYLVTHQLGNFARSNGYSGILAPSARDPFGSNLVMFPKVK